LRPDSDSTQSMRPVIVNRFPTPDLYSTFPVANRSNNNNRGRFFHLQTTVFNVSLRKKVGLRQSRWHVDWMRGQSEGFFLSWVAKRVRARGGHGSDYPNFGSGFYRFFRFGFDLGVDCSRSRHNWF